MRTMHPTAATRILNVGAAGTRLGLPDQFEAAYPHASRITGGGPSSPEVQDYQRSLPGVRAIVLDGCELPFADKSFDNGSSPLRTSGIP